MFLKEEVNYKEYASRLLGDMKKNSLGVDRISTLLIGEPGTGKTSFVKFFSRLLGLPLVLIEVPHISEEHLINIPFLVIDSEGQTASVETFESDFKLVRAKSVLATTLEEKKPFSKHEHERMLDDESDGLIRVLYEENKDLIDSLRRDFRCIMFFDEFYRVRSSRITNILRTFLNGKIGLDDIPEGVYTVYASNVNSVGDEGLNDIPLNHQFKTILFDAPGVREWFDYLEDKHKETLDLRVVSVFKRIMSEDNIFFMDLESEVMVSPRRAEEIVLYINALYKGGYEKGFAKEFIGVNTRNYLNGKKSTHYGILLKVVESLFEESSSAFNWVDVLKNQIEMKQLIGASRNYTPCLSGKPGVSKTSTVRRVGEEFGLNVISIDCSTLNPEDTIGIPNLKGGGTDSPEVFFTEPMLYSLIMEGYKKGSSPTAEGDYGHILFLDEINRTTPAVFNSIRRVVLDKEVNECYPLPDDIMVVAALNPDGEGTIELTPHLKDVLDIIPSDPLFEALLDYVEGFDHVRQLELDYGIDGRRYVKAIFEKLSLRFSSDSDEAGEPLSSHDARYFYLMTSDGNTIYLSPREMTTISLNILYELGVFLEVQSYDRYKRYSEVQYEDFEASLKSIVFEVFRENFRFVGIKHGIENREIERTIALYLNHLMVNEGDLFRLLENIYSESAAGLFQMAQNIDFSIEEFDSEAFVFAANNYISNADSIEQIVNDFNELLDYVVNKMEFKSYSELYGYYLSLFKVAKRMDFSIGGNQLRDRISKVFEYNYREITNKIKSSKDMYEILSELGESKVLDGDEYKSIFEGDKAVFKVG